MQPSLVNKILFLVAITSTYLYGGKDHTASKTEHLPSKSGSAPPPEGGSAASAKATYSDLLVPMKAADVPASYSKEEILRSKELLDKLKNRVPIRVPGNSYTTYEGEDPEGYQRALDQQQEWRVNKLEQEKNRQRLSRMRQE